MANNVTITGIKYGTTTITASYTDGGVTKTSSVNNFQVTAIAPTLTFTKSSSTITYNGDRKAIGTVSYNGDGTAYYLVIKADSQPSTPAANATTGTGWVSVTNGGTVYATNNGVASDAGTYWVFLKATATTGGNYTAVNPKYGNNKEIGKRTVTVATTPVVKSTTIQYTGSAQALLSTNGASSTGGQMYYYVSTTNSTPTVSGAPGTGWSTTAPSKTDVGTYYIWYYVYISDKNNNQAGTNVETVKSLGSKAIEKRTGAAPTFSASSVSATCTQGSNATTSPAVNAGTSFTAATAGHSGSITYSIQNVVKDGTSTSLSGWTMTSNTSRVITVPQNTEPATYKVTVRATEGATTTDTSSYKDAVITVTLGKGSQTLNLDKTTLSLTVPNTGTITASGYVGTLTVSSGTPAVATATNEAASTITAVSSGNASNNTGTSTITFTAAATTYLNSATKTATVTVTRRTGTAPTFSASTVTATCSQDQTAKTTTAFSAGTAGHSGSLSYAFVSAKKHGESITLTGWSVNSSNRTIGIPANTPAGTYDVVVRCNEGATTTDTSSYKDATITVTLSKGTQSLTITNNPSSKTITYNNTGTITASGHVGTISASSASTGVATVSTSDNVVTVQSVTAGTSVITVTAAANEYVNEVSTTVTWTVNRRTGSAPTFNTSSVTATCVQGSDASTSPAVNAGAFTAATATHSGSLTYSIVSVVKDGSSTELTGWSMTSTTSRVIKVPANTLPATYKVTVRATEGQTSTDTSSHTDKVITVTLNKGSQTLTIDNSTLTITVPNTDTITASGYVGTLSATSGTTGVATVSTNTSTKKVTVTAVTAGTSTVTVKAAATDYLNQVTKTCTVTVNRRTGAAPTFNNSSVTATCSQDQSAKTTSVFTAGTAGHSGSLSYELVSAKNSGGTTLTGWSVDSTNRTIGIPANTVSGTYTVVVRCNEGQTSTDTSSSKDATITVTLSKGDQTLTLNKDSLTLTVGGSTGSITASGYVGTLSVTSSNENIATATNEATSTITAVSAGSASATSGTATITFTAAANNYVNSVSKTATVTVNKRTGAAPTFNDGTASATLVQAGSARTTSAFTAGTAGHSGGLSYSLVGVTKSGSSTALTGWSVNSTNRTIGVPANTAYGTYLVVVRCTEAATSTDTSSTKDATITVTLSRGTQTLNLDKTELTLTVPNTGTITASGYSGTLSVTSGTTSVATASNAAASTITAVSAGTSTITFTAAATNYVNSVTKTATVTVNRREGAAPTFNDSSVSATLVQTGSARTTSAFTAATAGHSGTLSYTLGTVTKSGSSTALTGWTIDNTNRKINVPANTAYGTYYATVTANEAQTSTDTASSANATITITLSRGTQTLTLDKTELTLTYPTTGTIKATGYAGTLSVSSGTTTVATATNTATSTITPVGAGQSTITFTAAATDYVESVTKTATVTVNRRTGAQPTFNASTVTATCSQDASAKTTTAFTAATPGHSGSLSYSLVSVTNSGGTSLSNWSVNSSNRTIGIPANTPAGTYTVVVKATEAQTTTDTASEKNATITVTLSKGTQTLTLTGNPTNYTSTYNSGGTITASGHAGTISATSGTTGVATVSVSGSVVTVTCVKAGTSSITVTAGATDYVEAVSKSQTWTINKASRSGVVKSAGDVTSMTYGTTLQMSVSCSPAAGAGGTVTWGVTNGTGTATINSSGVLTATKPGTVTVTASVAATTNYAAYTPTSKTITINKATLTVTEVNYSGTWDGNTHKSTVTVTKTDWDGKTIVSGTSTSYGTTVTSNGTYNTEYTLKEASAYTASTTIYYKITGGTYYNDYTDSVTFSISKAAATLPGTISGDRKDMDHIPARATVSKDYTGGTLQYSTNNGTNWNDVTWYSGNLTANPSSSTLGDTSVLFRVNPDGNHTVVTTPEAITLTVVKATDPSVTITLASGTITYTGSGQTIATASDAHGLSAYYMGYKKDSQATADSQITWGNANTTPLQATNAGDYYVYYKFTANPDTHTGDKECTYVGKVTINKASRSGAVSCANTTYPTTVTATVSCSPAGAAGGTVTWGVTPGTGTATINSSGVVTPTQAGTVTITATVAATANYLGYTATSKQITISKGTGVLTYSTSNPAAKYCTDTANPADATDENKTFTIATSSASSSTNTGTGVSITYTISESGWSISEDGKTVTVPEDTAAGTYNITVTANVTATTNYNAASSSNSVKIVLNPNALESIEFTLAANTIAFNGTTTGTVIAKYTNNQTKDVTSGATYSSNPTGIVTITK